MKTERKFDASYNSIKDSYNSFKEELTKTDLPKKFNAIKQNLLTTQLSNALLVEEKYINEDIDFNEDFRKALQDIYKNINCIQNILDSSDVKEIIVYIKNNVHDDQGKVNSNYAILHGLLERLRYDLLNISNDIEELFLTFDQLPELFNLDVVYMEFEEHKGHEKIYERLGKKELSNILIKAVDYSADNTIDYLLMSTEKADPFFTMGLTTSAFSTALSQEREDSAQKFIIWKINKDKNFKERYQDLTQDFEEGEFAYYIASHICRKDEELKDFLFADDICAIRNSYLDAIHCCKILGTYDDDLVLGNDYV